MSTSFPTSVNPHPNPGPTTKRNAAGFELDGVISTLGDTSEAVQTKLGTGASAQTPAANTVLGGDGAGATSYRKVTAGDIASATITASQIANNAIGTAQISDSQVTTAKLAANAATQSGFATAWSASTTSTSYVDASTAGVTLTTVGGVLLVWAVNCVSIGAAGGNACYLALSLDGAAEVAEVATVPTTAGFQVVNATCWRFTGVTAGSHIVKARWKVTGSTMTNFSGQLLVEEQKR